MEAEMTMRNQNAAAKRAANMQLRPGDVWAEKERWLPCVKAVQAGMKAQGVERPAGLQTGGTLVMNHYMLVSGYVKWIVRYEFGREWIVIGGFVTEYLEDDDRKRMPLKPLDTHGKVVMVNQKVTGQLARPVHVLVDASGLPVPVPPEVWNAQFA